MTGWDGLATVTLPELDQLAAFRARVDRKYLVPTDALDRLLEALAPTHAMLEIDGRRRFRYDSVYFDTPDRTTARAHVQRRRRRFKCRTRLYVDSEACALEVKLRAGDGRTVKHRMPYARADHGRLTDAGRAFVSEHTGTSLALEPALRTAYDRLTLASPGERVTIDVDVSFGATILRPGWAIVETKGAHRAGRADAALRALGCRPVALSKYVLGTGLTHMSQPPNDLRRVARRYFVHAQ